MEVNWTALIWCAVIALHLVGNYFLTVNHNNKQNSRDQLHGGFLLGMILLTAIASGIILVLIGTILYAISSVLYDIGFLSVVSGITGALVGFGIPIAAVQAYKRLPFKLTRRALPQPEVMTSTPRVRSIEDCFKD